MWMSQPGFLDRRTVTRAADGRLCVGAVAREGLLQALERMRALPDAMTVDEDFQSAVVAVETALTLPVALEVSTYYELAVGIEDAMASAFQRLVNQRPTSEASRMFLTALCLAHARGWCFRYFAKFPADEKYAVKYLFRVCGVYASVEASVVADTGILLHSDARALAAEMHATAQNTMELEPELSVRARRLADNLLDAQAMKLFEFFEERAEMTLELVSIAFRLLLLHEDPDVIMPEGDRANAIERLTEQICTDALSAAACDFLAGFYARRDQLGWNVAPWPLAFH